jgi:HEAT repeat protein
MPGTESFLAARETNETSAGVLMILISRRHGGAEAYQQRFLALFLPLLTNPDESVRTEALMFIGANSNSAPMYHIPFGMDVFDRVIASAKAQSAGERFAAVFALVEVRNLDPDRARETFLNLVNDPDDDVRWRIAYGLADQLEREDVQKAIATLLQDKSPLVRYFTILVAGAAKHIPELEALSKGPNAEVADWAAQQLTQLAHPQGSPRTPNEP